MTAFGEIALFTSELPTSALPTPPRRALAILNQSTCSAVP